MTARFGKLTGKRKDSQCTYYVKITRVHETIVGVEKQCVCVCVGARARVYAWARVALLIQYATIRNTVICGLSYSDIIS